MMKKLPLAYRIIKNASSNITIDEFIKFKKERDKFRQQRLKDRLKSL